MEDLPKGYKVVGYDNGPIAKQAPPESEARFGDRLRAFVRGEIHVHEETVGEVLVRIAAAIDHDAEELRGELAVKQRALKLVRADLRRRVEEAVGRLGLGLAGRDGLARDLGLAAADGATKRWLDVEPFLEEVARIFGGLSAEPPGR